MNSGQSGTIDFAAIGGTFSFRKYHKNNMKALEKSNDRRVIYSGKRLVPFKKMMIKSMEGEKPSKFFDK